MTDDARWMDNGPGQWKRARRGGRMDGWRRMDNDQGERMRGGMDERRGEWIITVM